MVHFLIYVLLHAFTEIAIVQSNPRTVLRELSLLVAFTVSRPAARISREKFKANNCNKPVSKKKITSNKEIRKIKKIRNVH